MKNSKKSFLGVLSLLGIVGMLSACGKTGDGSSVATHTHDYGELVAAKSATCTEEGNAAYYYCEGCNKYFTEAKEETTWDELAVDALGHDYGDFVPGKEASCFESGNIGYYECSRCAQKFNGQKEAVETVVIPAHLSDEDLIPEIPATCEDSGMEAHYECSDPEHQGETLYFNEDKESVGEDELVIPSSGHTYGAVDYSWNEAGTACTATRVCTKCQHPETETVNGSYFTDTEAKCGVNETGHYEVSFTNAAFADQRTEANSYTKADTALEHDWTEWTVVSGSEPTCTESGTEERSCQRNGCEGHETRTKAALGHQFVKVNATQAGCATAGNKEYWQCERCQAYAEDANGETPISNLETWKAQGGKGYVAPTGNHTYNVEGKTTLKEEATCTHGSIYYLECDCGDTSNTTTTWEDNDKLAHSYGDVVPAVEATCTTGGNVAYKQCSVCNAKAIEVESEWVEVPANEENTKVFIAKLGHNFGDKIPAADATYEASGVVEDCYYCDRCEKHFDSNNDDTCVEITEWSTAQKESTYLENELVLYDMTAESLDLSQVKSANLVGYTAVNADGTPFTAGEVGTLQTAYLEKASETTYKVDLLPVTKVLKTMDDLKFITANTVEGIKIEGYYVLGNDIEYEYDSNTRWLGAYNKVNTDTTRITNSDWNTLFKGTFDGLGHKIINYIAPGRSFTAGGAQNGQYESFFSMRLAQATVKNVVFDGVTMVGQFGSLFSVFPYQSTIENVTVNNLYSEVTTGDKWQGNGSAVFGGGQTDENMTFKNVTVNLSTNGKKAGCLNYLFGYHKNDAPAAGKENTYINCEINNMNEMKGLYLKSNSFVGDFMDIPDSIQVNRHLSNTPAVIYDATAEKYVYTEVASLGIDNSWTIDANPASMSAGDWVRGVTATPTSGDPIKVDVTKVNGAITTFDELQSFSSTVNTAGIGSGTYVIAADLTLTADFGLTSSSKGFGGTFDGRCHLINFNNKWNNSYGLFGNIIKDTTVIKNLNCFDMRFGNIVGVNLLQKCKLQCCYFEYRENFYNASINVLGYGIGNASELDFVTLNYGKHVSDIKFAKAASVSKSYLPIFRVTMFVPKLEGLILFETYENGTSAADFEKGIKFFSSETGLRLK